MRFPISSRALSAFVFWWTYVLWWNYRQQLRHPKVHRQQTWQRVSMHYAVRVCLYGGACEMYSRGLDGAPCVTPPSSRTDISVLCSVQSHLFLSPTGVRTLKIPVPYLPSNVGSYTQTPSHQPLVFGRRGTDHLPLFWVFGLLRHHTASNPITTEMHTSGAQ